MQRIRLSAAVSSLAALLALSFASCGNSSTTYECSHNALSLESQPSVGTLVRIYLSNSVAPTIGTVIEVDEQIIQLDTWSGGELIANWAHVAAWEQGASVQLELFRLEKLEEMMQEYSRETNELISKTAGILPGSESEASPQYDFDRTER